MSLSNNDYQDIMRQYEARRLSNYRLHEQRKKDIYTTIPEIRDLDRQITSNQFLLESSLSSVMILLYEKTTVRRIMF